MVWHHPFSDQVFELRTIRSVVVLLEAEVAYRFLSRIGVWVLLVAPLTIKVQPVGWRSRRVCSFKSFTVSVIFVIICRLHGVPDLACCCKVNECFIMNVTPRE